MVKAAGKSLFSEWVEYESGYDFSFNISDAKMGLNIMDFYGTVYPYRIEDGFGWCSYELTIVGDETRGDYLLENGIQHGVDTSITTGFACGVIEGFGTYEVSNNVLELCDVGGCVYYE